MTPTTTAKAETSRTKLTIPSDQEASGRSFDDSELDNLRAALASGTLTSTKGRYTKELQKQFAELVGAEHGLACSSGTSAIHCAIAAIDPEPADEIISSPITDMGALAPILYQGAIPVFADVDPRTCNLTAESIESRLSDRTRAIVVTHLFGNPCEMESILDLASSRNIPVIEDCAQAFLAESQGRTVGTLGDVGCFSLQQGKHITCGEGGLVVTSSEAHARRMFLFINKAWGYGDAHPDHYFLALNSRMSELQGAVALAQLEKLEALIDHRVSLATHLSDRLEGLASVRTPKTREGDRHVFWRYCLHIDTERIPGGPSAIADALREDGIFTAPNYVKKPAFECAVFRDQQTFGNSRFPFSMARSEAVDYSPENFRGAYQALNEILVVPFNEGFTLDHVDFIADRITACVKRLEA